MNAACGWQVVKCRYTPHVHIVSPRSSRNSIWRNCSRWRFQRDEPSNGKCRACRITPQVKYQQTFTLPVFFARTCPLDHVDWTLETLQFLPSAAAPATPPLDAPPRPTATSTSTFRPVFVSMCACRRALLHTLVVRGGWCEMGCALRCGVQCGGAHTAVG